MKSRIALVTTCMGRLAHLQQTLPGMAQQADSECILVDYACPEHSGEWAERNCPTVKVVRTEGASGFNLARARNAGAAACEADWLCFIDADVRCAPGFAAEVSSLLEPGFYYRPLPPDTLTWGTAIVARSDFERVGGYDEVMVGWGGEDDDLYARLQFAGCRMGGFPGHLLQGIEHGDAARVRHYAIKDRELNHRINALYLCIKSDMSRLAGRPVPLEIRRTLYADLSRIMPEADATKTSAQMNIDLARVPFLQGRMLDVRLEYTLGAAPGPATADNLKNVKRDR
jgi:glycosyltransferase involved in cell wall biosynthesis